MGHQSVDRAEWGTLGKDFINHIVAIGYPLFAVGTCIADKLAVGILSPYSIAIMEPEWRCPCTHSCIKEYIGTCFAHLSFYTDNTFCIFNTSVSLVRSEGCTLSTDTIELKEAEIVIVYHAFAAVNEVVVIRFIAQLHTSTVVPVVATISAATTIASDRSEPSTNAYAHALSQVVFAGKTIWKVWVESPCAISIPTIIEYKGIRGFAIYIVELFLPVFHHVNALCGGHVLGVVTLRVVRVRSIIHTTITYGIVAVNIEFVPRIVKWKCTPRYCTLTFAISQERTTSLSGSYQTYNSANLPRLVLLECSVASPISLHSHLCRNLLVVFGIYLNGVYTHRSFKTGKYFIAGKNGATCVAYYHRCGLCLFAIHIIYHRCDRLHGYVFFGSHVKGSAQIVATIAQHSMPNNKEFVFFKYSFKTLTIKAVRTLYCVFIANEFFGFYAYQLHIRRSEVVTIAQYHLKQFGAWLKVHFFAAIKNEFAVNFGKLGCKQ